MNDDLIDQLRRQAFGWCQQMCNEAADEIERLKAIVDAIPDKDDPLTWVRCIEKNLNDRFDKMLAAKQTRNELLQAELDALRDAIPGDDKRLVAEWVVTIAAEELLLRDACPNHDEGFTTAVLTCPPSVRAALRGEA